VPGPAKRRSDGRDERRTTRRDGADPTQDPLSLAGENRRLRAELERARETQARERLSRDEFLSFAAHELRTPLTLILGFSQTLARRLRHRPEAARDLEDLERVIGATRRLSGMLDEMLDISRLESGRVRLSPRPASLPDLVRQAIAGFRPATPIELTCEPGLPDAQVDAARAEQILKTLVRNAMRVTPPDSPVVVRVGRSAGWLAVQVEDRGRPVREEMLPRLFGLAEPYPEPVEGRSGLGLGLFVAAGIARAMGGDLRLERRLDDPTTGNRFVLTLPRAEPESDHGAGR
jgi:signal transduction histidine kinase